MYGSYPPSHKGILLKVTLAYRLLVAVPAKVETNVILQHENESSTQHYTIARRLLLHRAVTKEGYSSPNDKPRFVQYYDVSARDRLTTMTTIYLLWAYASYTYE
jgi:hypothetical protein